MAGDWSTSKPKSVGVSSLGDSLRREWIDKGREGVHHIRLLGDDLDRVLRAIAPNGFHSVWSHRIPIAAWFYVEHESGDGVLLEFLQMISS